MANRVGLRVAGSSSVVDGKSDRWVDVYTTDYTSRAAALLDAQLPRYGTQHPNQPGIFVDSYSFTPVSDGRYDIAVNYSNDGSFKLLENVQQTPDDGPRLQFGIKTVRVVIPSFAMSNKSIPAGPTTSQLINSWEPVGIAYEEARAMVSYRVVVPTLNLADINVMSDQIHKIHLLGGVKFEMQPWSQVPQDKLHDQVTYYWVRDRGTIDPRQLPQWNAAQAMRLSIPPVISNTNPPLIRLPYTNRIAIPSSIPFDADENPTEPDYFTIPFALEDLNGWMSLPGFAP